MIQLISPINEKSIRPHAGKPVCAVMKDGTHVFGYVDGVRDGKLYFSNSAYGIGTLSTSAYQAKRQLERKMSGPKSSAFGYGGYSGCGFGVAWDIVLISLLFLLPFLWF
ncbi:hypothetical protein [Paenibacillus turpanensis]|uniref:hypothetical protein n=1 Tax=Paenibacillus turpanensis TaxID=2689078 RepID=UPI00140DCF91|nr:hypothetical protein [Paenibacillus turpanensis]